MRTTAQEVAEAEILDARLLTLHAEKARIDADIAATTEDLRRLHEDQLFDYLTAATSADQVAGRPVKRRQTNLADTTTATSIACLLRISERAAHRLVQHSNVLMNYQPATHQALHDGLISWQHATTIIDECTGLPGPTATLLETELLTLAQDTTTTKLAYHARKLRTRLHPDSLDARARTATENRRVDLDPAHDAMAWLHIYLPATDATAIDTHLTQTARTLQSPTEHRTLPQLRTDILTDLLLTTPTTCTHPRLSPGASPATSAGAWAGIGAGVVAGAGAGPVAGTGTGTGDEAGAGDGADSGAGAGACECVGDCGGTGRIRAHINVTVPVLTLLGVADEPADLEGYGPIPADVARRLAAHAPSFTRLLTHPETGAVLSVGRTTYAVPADLKKWLRVRDRTCRHPGCNIPASRCELDHTTPWSQGGSTSHDNLAHLCRKHHKLKSEGIWHYTQHPGSAESGSQGDLNVGRGGGRQLGAVTAGSGVLTATSPFGRTYLSHPEPPPF